MNQLKEFLLDSKNNVDKEFTHTTMPGSSIPAKAYCIRNLDEFYKIYYKHVFKLGLPAHVTEAPDSNGISQIKVDIDLKYNHTAIYPYNLFVFLLCVSVVSYSYILQDWC